MDIAALARIRVVLVETSHPGNIGAVARAMWTMGLERLYLVSPARFPAAEATARAAGADEVLYNAVLCDTLADALADCGWAAATSGRARRIEWPRLGPREWAGAAVERAGETDIAIVFGREASGLSNAELDLCQVHVDIPTNPAYRSLNLASAVQVLAYEVRQAMLADAPSDRPVDGDAGLASADQMEGLYAHLDVALQDIGYLDPSAPKLLMRRLRSLFSRARLRHSELNIVRGILAAAQRAAGKGSG